MVKSRIPQNETASNVECFIEAAGTFNPWKVKVGKLYAIEIVERRRDLTDGQKLLYTHAARWAIGKGYWWPSFETMADALGKSVRQVKSDMAALEKIGLITHIRRGRHDAGIENSVGMSCNAALGEVQDSAKVKCSQPHLIQEVNQVEIHKSDIKQTSVHESQKNAIHGPDVRCFSPTIIPRDPRIRRENFMESQTRVSPQRELRTP